MPAADPHVPVSLFLSSLTSLATRKRESQRRNSLDNFMCCHTEVEVPAHTLYLTQPQYIDTGSASPSTDPGTPSALQCGHPGTVLYIMSMTQPGQCESVSIPIVRCGHLTAQPKGGGEGGGARLLVHFFVFDRLPS